MEFMKKKPASPNPVVNRRARYDYTLGDEVVAGLVLTGPEVRAARDNHVQLKGAYVQVKDNELWLQNASFSLKINDKGISGTRSVDISPRKLLAKRREIDHLLEGKKQGMTIVPTKLLTAGRYIKVVIALGKGKKNYDKRQTIKQRDLERENRS